MYAVGLIRTIKINNKCYGKKIAYIEIDLILLIYLLFEKPTATIIIIRLERVIQENQLQILTSHYIDLKFHNSHTSLLLNGT